MHHTGALRAARLRLSRKVGFPTFLLCKYMQLQIFFTPGCIACLAMKILVNRIRPDYPELAVEEIDAAARPLIVAQYRFRSAPGIAINGKLVARTHIKEAELRRAILRRRRRPRSP